MSWACKDGNRRKSWFLCGKRLNLTPRPCPRPVNRRKSKLVTIYDLKLRFAYTQKQPPAAEGEEAVSGTLTALEVGHDMDEDEYQFESNVGQTGDLAMQLRQEARKSLADKLRPIFQQLPKVIQKSHAFAPLFFLFFEAHEVMGNQPTARATQAMISAHGNTLLKDSSGGSGTSTPTVPASSTSAAATASTSSASAASAAATKSDTGKVTNTTTVKTSSPFKIAASDLFELLTDPSKVPMWTRNPAQIKPEAGAEVSLFGGNVLGKIISVNKPSQIVMTWRPPQWEAGKGWACVVSS